MQVSEAPNTLRVFEKHIRKTGKDDYYLVISYSLKIKEIKNRILNYIEFVIDLKKRVLIFIYLLLIWQK
jgi:hypothetical protein